MIATLRALGFGSSPVVISILLESLALALIGGAIGAAIAFVAFDGFTTSTMNWQTFSQVAFAFQVSPALLMRAITWSISSASVSIAACGVFSPVTATATFFHHSWASFG